MAEEKRERKIELQNYEVEEMLGRVPGWITRNGMILFLFLLLVLLFGSWMLKYPDIKKARIVVTSVNPPADLEARSSGKIARLFVADDEVVSAGDVLAMIENPAGYEDVMELKNNLGFLDSTSIRTVSEDLPDLKNKKLGTLQTDYSSFLKAYRDYMEFKRLDYYQQKIDLSRSKLVKQQEYSVSLSQREEIAKQDYDIAQRQYNRNADLFEQKLISQEELEKSSQEMLAKKNTLGEIQSLMAENNIEVDRIGAEIVDYQLKQQDDASGYVNTLEEALNNLKASIAAWEQHYLLVAPLSGNVTFTRFWSENQNVKAGEKVLTIIPEEKGSIIGKISLPMEGAGKVHEGLQVNVRFDNYPYLEFGMVRGKVSNISEVPDENYYVVEVEFPDGLYTYYKKRIEFSQNMQGQAEILTDKKRVLDRVLEPIRSALSRQGNM